MKICIAKKYIRYGKIFLFITASDFSLQIRSRSPEKKCTIRQDKLFIDNQMYVYDEDKHEVVRHARPPSPPRAPSRNYTNLDTGLRRSADNCA